MKLDDTEKKLLNIIQTDVPLSREPFASLGERLDISDKEVISRIEKLKAEGIIRQIGPVFNPRRLGYQTTLVAMKVTTELLDEAGRIISAHQHVSHCYERDHEFNLWFTLAMPLKENLNDELRKLKTKVKAETVLSLPAVRVFKLGAYFNLDSNDTSPPNVDTNYNLLNAVATLSDADRTVINELQQDLPLTALPFDLMAARLSMDIYDFLGHCRALLRRTIMRRFSASINHNKLGFTANAMACWQVPPDIVEIVGKKMTAFPEISHCYERQTSTVWPYNLFAMIHAKTKKACEAVADKISSEAQLDKAAMVLLFSTREVKKTRVRYSV